MVTGLQITQEHSEQLALSVCTAAPYIHLKKCHAYNAEVSQTSSGKCLCISVLNMSVSLSLSPEDLKCVRDISMFSVVITYLFYDDLIIK